MSNTYIFLLSFSLSRGLIMFLSSAHAIVHAVERPSVLCECVFFFRLLVLCVDTGGWSHVIKLASSMFHTMSILSFLEWETKLHNFVSDLKIRFHDEIENELIQNSKMNGWNVDRRRSATAAMTMKTETMLILLRTMMVVKTRYAYHKMKREINIQRILHRKQKYNGRHLKWRRW